MKNRKIFTIPNLLSAFRLVLVPVFVWAYIVKDNSLLATLVLAVSGITDMLDGQIARRFNMVSDLGKMLDPIADKVTQGVVMICMLSRFPAMWVPLGLLVVKDAFVGITNLMIIRRTGQIEGAAFHGKVASCFLDGLVLLHVLWSGMPDWLSITLITLTTLVMLLSLFLYGMRNLANLRRIRARRNMPCDNA